jgi:hypothetical protein
MPKHCLFEIEFPLLRRQFSICSICSDAEATDDVALYVLHHLAVEELVL